MHDLILLDTPPVTRWQLATGRGPSVAVSYRAGPTAAAATIGCCSKQHLAAWHARTHALIAL